MSFSFSKREIKVISNTILFLTIFPQIILANDIKASSAKDEFCYRSNNDLQCRKVINSIPPINNLPRIETSGPIEIKVIPYKKRYKSFKEKNIVNSTKFSIGDDSYLYELR